MVPGATAAGINLEPVAQETEDRAREDREHRAAEGVIEGEALSF